MTENNSKISKKLWLSFILFGLIGQIAWAVENMYFNVFVYNSFSEEANALIAAGAFSGITPLEGVKLMVQFSGITATIATLLAGALSDRIANRRRFISIGYIIWGFVIASFALITRDNIAALYGLTDASRIITAAIVTVVVMDCVMTLFGSAANDAAFNAWVTDNTNTNNRGRAEGVLSALPLVAMLIVAGGFGIIKDALGYPGLFLGLGGVVLIVGIIGIFTVKDSPLLVREKGNYFKNIFYGFRPSVIKKNAVLYITLIAVALYGIASQVFFPYIIIYLEHYIGLNTLEYSVVLGSVILLATVGVIIMGKMSDKRNKTNMLFLALGVFVIGLLAMYLSTGEKSTLLILMLCLTGAVAIFGYVALLALFNAKIRDLTPENAVGRLQGIRIFFYVLIPMFIGPEIGDAVIQAGGAGHFSDVASGAAVNVPVPEIFLWAAILALTTLIPLYFIKRSEKTNNQPEPSKTDEENIVK